MNIIKYKLRIVDPMNSSDSLTPSDLAFVSLFKKRTGQIWSIVGIMSPRALKHIYRIELNLAELVTPECAFRMTFETMETLFELLPMIDRRALALEMRGRLEKNEKPEETVNLRTYLDGVIRK